MGQCVKSDPVSQQLVKLELLVAVKSKMEVTAFHSFEDDDLILFFLWNEKNSNY